MLGLASREVKVAGALVGAAGGVVTRGAKKESVVGRQVLWVCLLLSPSVSPSLSLSLLLSLSLSPTVTLSLSLSHCNSLTLTLTLSPSLTLTVTRSPSFTLSLTHSHSLSLSPPRSLSRLLVRRNESPQGSPQDILDATTRVFLSVNDGIPTPLLGKRRDMFGSSRKPL